MGYFKKTNAFLVYFIFFDEIVHDKWCSHKSVWQIENGLECDFVKHWLNYWLNGFKQDPNKS